MRRKFFENNGDCYYYVYVDDIIIFSKDEQLHIEHVNQVFKTLIQAHTKIQLDKDEFFRFVVSKEGIKTNPKKVETILKFDYLKECFHLTESHTNIP